MTEYVKRVKKKGVKRSNTTIKKWKAITSFREAKAAKQKLIIYKCYASNIIEEKVINSFDV